MSGNFGIRELRAIDLDIAILLKCFLGYCLVDKVFKVVGEHCLVAILDLSRNHVKLLIADLSIVDLVRVAFYLEAIHISDDVFQGLLRETVIGFFEEGFASLKFLG